MQQRMKCFSRIAVMKTLNMKLRGIQITNLTKKKIYQLESKKIVIYVNVKHRYIPLCFRVLSSEFPSKLSLCDVIDSVLGVFAAKKQKTKKKQIICKDFNRKKQYVQWQVIYNTKNINDTQVAPYRHCTGLLPPVLEISAFIIHLS